MFGSPQASFHRVLHVATGVSPEEIHIRMTQGGGAHVKGIGLAGEVTRNFHPRMLQYGQSIGGAYRENGINARIVCLDRRPELSPPEGP